MVQNYLNKYVFLLQSIVNDKDVRQILRSNKSFSETIEYIYKRLFNKISIEDDKYQQLIRSTPKRLIRLTKTSNNII